MPDKPTFSILDDYVALMELKPAARTVYGLLRCNAAFGRNGVPDHAVHVTSSWFTEMTSHWESPVTAPTARRGLNELIDKGVLIRVNEPQDGTGFVVAFVADPGPQYKGPVNGFQHAERVSKRCGTKAFYRRTEGVLGTPAVTGVRLGPRRPPVNRQIPPQAQPPEEYPDPGVPEEEEPLLEAEPPEAPSETDGVTARMRDFAVFLEERTGRMSEPRLRLMAGSCRRLAEQYREALERGWDPKALANRIASELNSQIKSPERFLASKAGDIGAPPSRNRPEVSQVDPSELEGLREAEVRRAQKPEGEPDLADEAEKALIAEEYQARRARRRMGGRRFPRAAE